DYDQTVIVGSQCRHRERYKLCLINITPLMSYCSQYLGGSVDGWTSPHSYSTRTRKRDRLARCWSAAWVIDESHPHGERDCSASGESPGHQRSADNSESRIGCFLTNHDRRTRPQRQRYAVMDAFDFGSC